MKKNKTNYAKNTTSQNTINKLKRKTLFITASLIWAIPGIIITIKGIINYTKQNPEQLWWLIPSTLAVMTFFYLIFNKITKKYIKRIENLQPPFTLWQTFPLKGWIILLIMMSLGMSLRLIPNLPSQFIAFFYLGLGPMLIIYAIKFCKSCKKNYLCKK